MKFTANDLKDFAENHINVKKNDLTDYRAQLKRLKERLADYIKENPEYGLVKMLNSGSVAKGTALRTINDMDVAVYVKANKVQGADESSILEYIREGLVKAHKRHNMTEDQFSIGHHCVKVSFKGSGLDVDVVPVIYDGEENNQGYLIRKDTGERVKTSISMHLDFIKKRKNEYPNFTQMIRVSKWWRDQQGIKFKSFLIEMIWAHIADTEGVSDDICTAMQQFFRYIVNTELREAIVFTDYYEEDAVALVQGVPNVFDPVNPDNNVAGNLIGSKLTDILDAADDGLSALTYAMSTSSKEIAEEELKKLFGSSFKL